MSDRVPARVMAALRERSGGWCELRGEQTSGSGCTLLADDPQHRVNRGMGGSSLPSRHALSRLLHVCRRHHDWMHTHPTTARTFGWLLRRTDNPATFPVLTSNGRVLLGDDGTTHPVED